MVKQISKAITVCLVSLAAVSLLSQTDFMVNLDNWASDLWHIWLGDRKTSHQVVLVTIDEDTLNYLPDPLAFWSPHFAKVIRNLKSLGVTAIGVDFLFQVSAEDWLERNTAGGSEAGRIYDVPLRVQLADGKVVLASVLSSEAGQNARLTLPEPGFLYALPDAKRDTGVTNFYLDPDGVVRKWVPYFGSSSGPYLSFALALVLKHLGLPPDQLSRGLEITGKKVSLNSEPLSILYQGPPGTFPRIAFLDLMADDAPQRPELANGLKGRIAIVGSDFKVGGDVHVTPYNRILSIRSHRLMSGTEIHANIVTSILSQHSLVPLPAAYRLALFLGLALAMSYPWNRFRPFAGLGWLIVAAIALIAVGYLLFAMANMVLPAASGILLLVFVYVGTYSLRLTQEERLRVYVRQVFDRYVSQQVVDLLLKNPKSVELEGQELPVTVLFADIRNFTALSEKAAPKEVVQILNTFFDKICPHILDEGGTIDKFMGDGIMAVFGAPVTYADHADRALRATSAIMTTLKEFQELLKEKRSVDFDIGVGLHSGCAVMGNIGSSRRREYTAIGDDVNIAARIEKLTRDLNVRVLITEAVVKAKRIDIHTGEGLDARLKGREEPVRVYPLVRVGGNAVA